MLNKKDIQEVKSYIKKLKKEGSTTAGVPGIDTPRAFSGEEGGDGASDIKRITKSSGYDIKAKKTRNHSIDLHEVNYREFKNDESRSTVKKVNESVLEINRKIREINSLISHSHRLKLESNLDDSIHWKKTNEALLKISKRMSEAANNLKKFANLREIESGNLVTVVFNDDRLREMLEQGLFKTSQFYVDIQKQQDGYSVDYRVNDEPILSFDVKNSLVFDENGEAVGNLKDGDIVDRIINRIRSIYKKNGR